MRKHFEEGIVPLETDQRKVGESSVKILEAIKENKSMRELSGCRVDIYKQGWDKRAEMDILVREKMRKDAMNVAGKLKDILVKEFSAEKVVLFGSVLKEGRFEEGSDIDIAVKGLDKKVYFKALARLMMESPFEIDLKPLESVSLLLNQRIKGGKVLYEKRKTA